MFTRRVLATLAVLLCTAQAHAAEFIHGGEFTLAGPLPAGCSAGAMLPGPQGYTVLALGQGECGCVDSYVHATSQVAWTVAPLISVDPAAPTDDDGCLEVSIAAYVEGADLTTLGTPTAVVIEDNDVSAAADAAHYMPASAAVTLHDVAEAAGCTLLACSGRLARVCLERVSTGICSTNEYAGDLLVEAIVVDKAP